MFFYPITYNTKYIACKKCKKRYDISDLSSLIYNINRELLALNKYFYTIYTFARIEIEQDYKLSMSDRYSSTSVYIEDMLDMIKNDPDALFTPMPRLDIVAYTFVQSDNNDNFILHADNINPHVHRFARLYKIAYSFREAIDMPYIKPFFEDTKFKNVKLNIFSNLAYLTSLYNSLYIHFTSKNALVLHPRLMQD